jgi:DNA modification methylase
MIDIRHGDCLDVLPTLAENSADAVVTDPPYHLTTGKRGGSGPASLNENSPAGRARIGTGFMGMKWDGGDVAMRPETWAAVLRVAKPGAYLLAFGGTRTHHRIMCAIEDAGWEIRDCLGWLFGSGFPKSANGEWGGSALKPAWEPIVMARKPLTGTLAGNFAGWGTGGLNINDCRIATDESLNGGAYAESAAARAGMWTQTRAGDSKSMLNGGAGEYEQPAGRWPANLLHDGSDEVVALFPQSYGQQGDVRGTEPSRTGVGDANCYGKFGRVPFAARSNGRDGEASANSANDGIVGFAMRPGARRGDEGSAARFFKQCEWSDEEWLSNLFNAPIAGQSLSLQSVAVCIAQSDAAISALPEGIRLSVSTARSMIVTPSESRLIAMSVIEAIQNFGQRCLRAWQHERLSPSDSRVNVVAERTSTGTMTITASHWRSDGSAEPVTFNITPAHSEHGEAASRFRYCAKADRADRNDGCDDIAAKPLNWSSGEQSPGTFQSPNTDRSARNHHPTVKPTDLMRYLCRLVTPKGGTVLDPFMGSGSTLKAAELEGFSAIGIEREAEYVAIARRRIAADMPLFRETA